MDRNLLDISKPIFLCWPSQCLQWSVSKAQSLYLNWPSFLFHRPIKVKVWVLSVKHLFFFRPELPEWGPDGLPLFCFLSLLFPAHYLREAAHLQDLRAWLLSPCSAESSWCSVLQNSMVSAPSCGQAPMLALIVRSDNSTSVSPLLHPFPFLLTPLHLFIFLATVFSASVLHFLFSELCFSPHFLSPLVVNPITSMPEW